jgi:hypothetical protein
MHCDRCHSPVPDDATIWRVSVGYSVISQSLLGAVQSWCAACASQFDHRNNLWSEAENWPEDQRQSLLSALSKSKLPHYRWHPAQPCDHCGRPVIFHAPRRIPLHAVCSTACRYALRLAQARAARRARQRPPLVCMICGRTFQSKRRANALTCSPVCRQRAYLQRQRAEVV